jgi:hypothetical protein
MSSEHGHASIDPETGLALSWKSVVHGSPPDIVAMAGLDDLPKVK